mmetsp:Transcript_3054/g.4463  ORF Transcript_3054/g.4463 Transcript_3054/m.4463 type:complete len:96 (+) Transcript_3054:283-570(+)
MHNFGTEWYLDYERLCEKNIYESMPYIDMYTFGYLLHELITCRLLREHVKQFVGQDGDWSLHVKVNANDPLKVTKTITTKSAQLWQKIEYHSIIK